MVLASLAGAVLAGAPAGEVEGFHTELEATFPAADSLFRGDVREIRLRFTTAVQLPLSSVRLLDGAGRALAGPRPDTVPATGGAELRLGLEEPLPTGVYTVRWRTAGPDSHPIEGEYGFTVERPAPVRDSAATGDVDPTAGEPPAGDPTSQGEQGETVLVATQGGGAGAGPGIVGVAVRWLFFVSLAGMLGTTVFRFAVAPVLGSEAGWGEAAATASRRLFRLAVVAAALGVIALPLRFAVQAAAFFGDEGVSTSTTMGLLSGGWGAGWLLELAAIAVFIAGVLVARASERPRRGWLLMLAASVAATVVPALSGHSRAVDPALLSLATVVDALHVAAASTWLGGLAALVLVGVGAARLAGGSRPGAALPRVVNAFSRVALAAVVLLLATGVVNAWLHLGSLDALWASGYGRTLAVKLALVAGAGALGFYNWRVVRPALEATPRPGLIRGPAAVELLLGMAVLAATAFLVGTPLPGSG